MQLLRIKSPTTLQKLRDEGKIGFSQPEKKRIVPFADKYKARGISDFITGLMEKHEKTAWMLRSHLKKS